eukprot:6026558-Pleurochrysis_carterae.AAC.1
MDVRVDTAFGLSEERGFDVFRQILGSRRVRGFEARRNAIRKADATIGGRNVDVEQVRDRPLVFDVPMVYEVSGELPVQRAIAV